MVDELSDIHKLYENLRKKGYSGNLPFTTNILKVLDESLKHVESSLNEEQEKDMLLSILYICDLTNFVENCSDSLDNLNRFCGRNYTKLKPNQLEQFSGCTREKLGIPIQSGAMN